MRSLKAEIRYTKASINNPHETNKKIAQTIRKIRESIGVIQEAFADRVGFCRNTITQIELGQRKRAIPLNTIYRIIEAFDLSMTLDEFLDLCGLP